MSAPRLLLEERPVYSLVRAVRVPGQEPYDTAHIRITYPAVGEPIDPVGTLGPDAAQTPLPVVLWSTGMNTDPGYYRWLGDTIARAGYVFVTFTYLGLVPPETVGITPGVDITKVTPDTLGTGPIGMLIQPVLDAVAAVSEKDGAFKGAFDMSRVVLGGHSAGGTISMETGSHEYVPALRGIISYAAHTMASTMLGWPAGTVLPLSGDAPILLMAGTEDGLVSASAKFYGETEDREDPIARTFKTLPDSEKAAGSWFVQLHGANHFSIAHPIDAGLPRLREDHPETAPHDDIRDRIGRMVTLFLDQHVKDDKDAGEALTTFLTESPLVTARSN